MVKFIEQNLSSKIFALKSSGVEFFVGKDKCIDQIDMVGCGECAKFAGSLKLLD